MEIRKYLTFFENETIQVFFFNHMPQKYQNGKIAKTVWSKTAQNTRKSLNNE